MEINDKVKKYGFFMYIYSFHVIVSWPRAKKSNEKSANIAVLIELTGGSSKRLDQCTEYLYGTREAWIPGRVLTYYSLYNFFKANKHDILLIDI